MTAVPEKAPDQAPDQAAASPPARPARKPFRKSFNAPRLTREEADRQGRLSRVAWDAWGDRDRVVAFLNGHDEALGGRPIDLAIGSDEGLVAVERAIAERP